MLARTLLSTVLLLSFVHRVDAEECLLDGGTVGASSCVGSESLGGRSRYFVGAPTAIIR